MFGLCLPTGVVYLIYNNGKRKNIMITDYDKPKKEMLNSNHILNWVKLEGYKNIKAIQYVRNGRTTTLEMFEYYYENKDKLEEVA